MRSPANSDKRLSALYLTVTPSHMTRTTPVSTASNQQAQRRHFLVRSAFTYLREKKLVLTRVGYLCGQVDALERALDTGADCGPVLQQIAAVRGAVNGLMAGVPESHLRE